MECIKCKRTIEQILHEDGEIETSSEDEEYMCKKCKEFEEHEAWKKLMRKHFGVDELEEENRKLKEQLNRIYGTIGKHKNKAMYYMPARASGKSLVDLGKIIEMQNLQAIEELEKLQSYSSTLLHEFMTSYDYQNNMHFRGHRHIEYYDLKKYINRRIEELRIFDPEVFKEINIEGDE